MAFSESMQNLLNEITKRHYQNIIGLKADITEEDYYYFLEVLPPIYSKQGGFMCLEAETHLPNGDAVRLWFHRETEKYMCEVVNETDHVKRKQLIEAGMI